MSTCGVFVVQQRAELFTVQQQRAELFAVQQRAELFTVQQVYGQLIVAPCGAVAPAPAPTITTGFLLEDGISFLLLEDGVSVLLQET